MLLRAFHAGLLCAALSFPFASPVAFSAETTKVVSPAEPVPATTFSVSNWDEFDQYAKKVLDDWHVPGAAIAVVKDGKVVHAAGYGVREVGTTNAVTPDTIFAIGSLSKAFTAFNIGQLVDEGKLTLDSPVTKYVPEFALSDSSLTSIATVKDLISMRTGLERGPCELMMVFGDFSPSQQISRLKYIQQKAPYRSGMAYINQMFVTAGEVIRSVSGKPWTEFVAERVIRPLKMDNTSVLRPKFGPNDNYAIPHAYIGNAIVAIPSADASKFAPAGSINSTVMDMTKWINLQLSDGTVNGTKLISKTSLDETHYPVIMGGRAFEATLPEFKVPEVRGRKAAYALGWGTMEYRDRPMVFHSGGIDGSRSHLALLPSEKIGVVVLSNCNYGDGKPADILKLTAIDFLLRDKGEKQIDWNRIDLPNQLKMDTAEEKERIDRLANRAQGTKPSLPLDRYTGSYTNAILGDLNVSQKDGKFRIIFNDPATGATLSHWQHDSFRALFDNKLTGELYLSFNLDEDAKPVSVSIADVGVFKRKK